MRIPFETNEDRDQIITDQLALGYVVQKIQRHVDGNWLVFKKPEPTNLELKDLVDNLNDRIDALEDRVELLENP